jgi:hypothetical protein
MSDTVHVTFQYAVGHQVRWAEEPAGPWRITERYYREGALRGYVGYRLLAATETDETQAFEEDLAPWEDR